MTRAWLGIGSNVDAERNVCAALDVLYETFGPLRLSTVYQSRAVGFDGDDFINLAVSIDTDLDALALRSWLRKLEDGHGRKRDVPKFSDRVLDVDIILFGDQVMDTPELELPRPEVYRFAHVLKPLADLDPELEMPGDGRSLAEIMEAAQLDESGLQAIKLPWPA